MSNNVRVILAPSLQAAQAWIAENGVPAVTVEAEYGATVIEGSRYTAAHHQPAGSPFAGDHVIEGGRPSPCVDGDIPELSRPARCGPSCRCSHPGGGIVLLSHLDLDSVGGALRALGTDHLGFWPQIVLEEAVYDAASLREIARNLETANSFWALAARVDVRGPHRAAEIAANLPQGAAALRALRAWWAWSRSPEGLPRIDGRGGAVDVTEAIERARSALWKILGYVVNSPDEGLLEAGDRFAAEEYELDRQSFVDWRGHFGGCYPSSAVILRRSAQFVNHLYTGPWVVVYCDGCGSPSTVHSSVECCGSRGGTPGNTTREVAGGVVALNTDTGAVTISLESPVPGVSCRAIVQSLWGPDAGGHDGIAGSPRGQVMTWADAVQAADALARALAGVR